MRVRLTDKGQTFFWHKGDMPQKVLTNKEPVVIIVDPSKSNMAILVGSVYGEIIEIIEVAGKEDDNSTRMNTTEYCDEFREFLITRYGKLNIARFYQEQAILKKGMEYYHSSVVLMEVRSLLIDVSMELTGQYSHEINNLTWKANVLPKELRKRDVKKGSKIYLKQIDSKYQNMTDDVTDAICMYMYVLKTYYKDEIVICADSEKCDYKYKYLITAKDRYKAVGRNFKYNNRFSLEENMNYVMNRVHSMCYTDINIDDIEIEYTYSNLKDITTYDKELRLILIPEKLTSGRI